MNTSRKHIPSIEDRVDDADANRDALEACYPPDEDEMADAARRRRALGVEDRYDIDESIRTVPAECEDREP